MINHLKFRKNYFILLQLGLLLIFTSNCGSSQQRLEKSIDKKVRNTVSYLASEDLAGRKAGEEGDSLAALFIKNQFEKAGLQLLFEDGFQPFSLVSSVEIGNSNQLTFNNLNYKVESDFLPYSFSANKSVTAPVVFMGYGFSIEMDSLKWNDYQNIDVAGKWVLLLKGDPEIDEPESLYAPFAEDRSKVLTAQDNGAAGVLLVAGPQFSEKDELQGLFYDKNSSTYSIPVIQITRNLADLILANSNTTVAQLEEKINDELQSNIIPIEMPVTGQADVVQQTASSNNVAAILPGTDPVLKDEYVVVGAHYDHLGTGGPGSGSRALDTTAVHYGADDNASGVAAVIATAIKASKSKNNRRSLIFTAFGAEEMGLIGATNFTANPPVDISKIVAMINFDMVGRLDNETRALSIGGSQTSLETEEILNRLNKDFSLAFSPEGSGPSDHAAFYMQDIPVFFVSTGAHGDYHTPTDVADSINFEGISEVADFMWEVAQEISNRDEPLTFQESGSKMRRSRGGRYKVTLGVMPDFAGLEKSGLRIDAVTKGKPADLAGIKKGDIITSINGNKVGNIYDYMNRLNSLEEGQTISLDIVREGKPVVLIVQL